MAKFIVRKENSVSRGKKRQRKARRIEEYLGKREEQERIQEEIRHTKKKGPKNRPVLSIICPAIIARIDTSRWLFKKIQQQIDMCPAQVELVILMDNCMGAISDKHEALNRYARGDYVMGIGDDDDLAPNFVQTVVDTITKRPGVDVITYKLAYHVDDRLISTFTYGRDQEEKHPFTNVESGDFPHARCPIRREIVQEYHYKTTRWFGEDMDFRDWMKKQNILQSEAHIDEVLYFSYFENNKEYGCAWKREQQDKEV